MAKDRPKNNFRASQGVWHAVTRLCAGRHGNAAMVSTLRNCGSYSSAGPGGKRDVHVS